MAVRLWNMVWTDMSVAMLRPLAFTSCMRRTNRSSVFLMLDSMGLPLLLPPSPTS